MSLPHNILPFVRQLLHASIRAGDTVLDATAGNGHDTAFLAQCVGETGKVWAFDIQQTALDATRVRLEQEKLTGRVRLIEDDHQHLDHYITQPLAAAVFNLGYLPNGDKNLTTKRNSTLNALSKALHLLKPDGLLATVLYGGHPAGEEECTAIEAWVQTLPQQQYDILRYQFANRPPSAPYALIFRKLAP